MSKFAMFLELGFEHISDIEGYDHMVFLLALCAVYVVSQWKEVLILVTAFTLGHSVTLALATLNIVSIPTEVIEFLIPVTIFATAVYNVVSKEGSSSKRKVGINYLMALFFGLIHGMGFSNYLRQILMRSESIFQPLLAFNLGLEMGQILIVAVILGLSFVFVGLIGVKQREWNLFVSGAAAGIALIIMIEKSKELFQ